MKIHSVNEYIANYSGEVRRRLLLMRKTIRAAAPKAEELISYGMPAYKQNGILLYFAAFKNHIGFYPTGRGMATLKKEMGKYKHSKGAVRFPLDQPLPLGLISKVVKLRVKQNAGEK